MDGYVGGGCYGWWRWMRCGRIMDDGWCDGRLVLDGWRWTCKMSRGFLEAFALRGVRHRWDDAGDAVRDTGTVKWVRCHQVSSSS